MSFFNNFNISIGFSFGMNNWFNPISSCFGGFGGFNCFSVFNFGAWFSNPICPTPISPFGCNSILNTNSIWNNYNSNYNFNFNSCTTNNMFSSVNVGSFWNNFVSNDFGFNIFSNNTPSVKSGSETDREDIERNTGTLQEQLVEKAKGYAGKVNSKEEGNRLFSNGQSRNWCADFVGYVVNETYGSKISDFPRINSVDGIRSWGKEHDCYYKTSGLTDKASFIAKNIKPGDIMIEKEDTIPPGKKKKKSHTGIVVKVYSDGSFDTVEGNTTKNSIVKVNHHKADSPTLSGFVTLDKYSV